MRYFRAIVTLWLITTAVTTCVMLLGRRYDVSNGFHRLGFGLCANTPCIKGVALGMTWQEVQAVTGQLGSGVAGNNWLSLPLGNGEVGIRASKDNQYVELIETSAVLMPSISDFIQMYGEPCGVATFGTGPNSLDLIYPHNMTVNVLLDKDNRIGMNSRVQDVSLEDSSLIFQKADCAHVGNSYIAPWLGFTTYHRFQLVNQAVK